MFTLQHMTKQILFAVTPRKENGSKSLRDIYLLHFVVPTDDWL